MSKPLNIVVEHATYFCLFTSRSEHQERVPFDWEVMLDNFEPLLKCQCQEESDKCVVSILSCAPIRIQVQFHDIC
jgi:hypothetical protein